MSASAAPQRERVLLVDDEPQVLVALEDLLSDEFVVMTCGSGERALEILETDGNVAVVVSDQRMPRMPGDALLAEVGRRTTASRILVTGFADLTAVIRAVNSGHLFAYIAKPWEPKDLKLKVQLAAHHFRLSQELAHERRLLNDLLTSTPDAIFFKDAELRFLRANRAFAELLDSAPEKLVGRRLEDLAPDPAEAARVAAEERRIVATGEPLLDVVRRHERQGVTRYLSESKAPIREADGRVVGIVGIARDVTQRVAQEASIARLTRVRGILSGVNAAILRASDGTALLRECCRVAIEHGELSLAGVSVVDPSGQLEALAMEPAGVRVPTRVRRFLLNGAVHPTLAGVIDRGQPVVLDAVPDAPLEPGSEPPPRRREIRSLALVPIARPGEHPVLLWLCSPKPDQFDAEELMLLGETADNVSFALASMGRSRRLDFLAYFDETTRLPNRQLLFDRTGQQLGAASLDAPLALVVVNVARMRQVNESFGRRGGDDLLLQIAQRIEPLVGKKGTAARLDGNVFALLVPAVDAEAAAASFAEHEVLAAFRQPFVVNDAEVRVAVRLGIALAPGDGDSAELLVSNAEAALKKAKATGQPYLFYSPDMNARVAEQLALETKLRRAVDHGEFLLHYQPKTDLTTGELVGLEALIRWQEPGGALVPPGRFIPVLEETGLIREVGRWVLERAALQYHEWSRAGRSPPRIAVNVSALQLAARDFAGNVERVLRHYPDGSGIDLEITESVFLDDLAGSIKKLEGARRQGLRVAIDDFGTGYSCLSYLGRLPIDTIKIDRSFVVRLSTDPQATSIVDTIISLAHAFGLEVVAEGVETAEQAQLLRKLGCDQAQGYLFARPEPAAATEKRLGSRFDLDALLRN